MEQKVFDSAEFMTYLDEKFTGFDSPFLRGLVENIVEYGIEHKSHTKDSLVYLLAGLIPEVEFGEVAMFADDSILTEYGMSTKYRTELEEAAGRLKKCGVTLEDIFDELEYRENAGECRWNDDLYSFNSEELEEIADMGILRGLY